jgi:hypothetical protein
MLGCREKANNDYTYLFKDTTGFNVKVIIPEDWYEYKGILKMTNENLLFTNTIGAPDTSLWMMVEIYKNSFADSGFDGINSILEWRFNLMSSGDSTIVFTSKEVKENKGGKMIGILNYSYLGNVNIAYCKIVVFITKDRIGILEINNQKSHENFLSSSESIVKSLEF